MRSFFRRIKYTLTENLGDTCGGAAVVSHFVVGILTGAALYGYFPVLPQTVWILIGLLLSVPMFGMLFLAMKLISKGVRKSVVYWLISFLGIYFTIQFATNESNEWHSFLLAFLFATGLDLLARCLFAALIKKRHRKFLAFCGMTSSFVVVWMACVIGSSGYANEELEQIFAAAGSARQALLKEKEEAWQKTYTALSAEYGPDKGAGLSTDTYDISYFMERDDVQEIGMDAYFSYDLTEVPLAGKVWYPKEAGSFPVLFLIHGNHTYTTPSYLGYDYLGRYLAKKGYVVVSVDERCCNDLVNENDARAILLLENMRALRTLGKEENCPFYDKIDWEQIAVAGHSRGGEAAATASLFNEYDSYPENGNISFSYHFPIKSVIAIAPTVDQYMPADHAVELANVNYLLLAGAYDQDVTVFMGMKQYENVTFSGNGRYLKSMLYIADANHGQFNELWGEYDMMFPLNRFLNTKTFLTEQEQQNVACRFIGTFLDVTLKGEREDEELLKNYAAYTDELPETIFVQSYQTSDFVCIANFDEDSELETATMRGATVDVSGLVKWTEEKRAYGDGGTDENYAAYFKWKKADSAQIIFRFAPYDMGGQDMTFDIADRNTERVENGNYKPFDGKIVVKDTAGEEAEVSISSCAVVYPPLPVQLYKTDALFGGKEWKCPMQTVTVRGEQFLASNPKINLGEINSLRLVFKGSGAISLDNVGFECADLKQRLTEE